MPEVAASVSIAAPHDLVWSTLRDLTAMRAYMPGIDEVSITSSSAEGEGATRQCRFADGVELVERVVDWRPPTGYTLETVRFKGVPMKSNRITFQIDGDDASTTVTQSMDFRMKGGPFAPVLAMMARGRMLRALDGALSGLKSHVEGQASSE